MKGFIIACVASLMFNSSVNTMVDVHETQESTDRIEQAINDNKEKENNNNGTTNITNDNDNDNSNNNNTTTNITDNSTNTTINGDYYDGCTIIGDNDNNRTSLPDDDTVTNYNLCPRCNEYTLRMIYNEDKPEYSFWYCDDCEFCLK